jgi:hypothetical protein
MMMTGHVSVRFDPLGRWRLRWPAEPSRRVVSGAGPLLGGAVLPGAARQPVRFDNRPGEAGWLCHNVDTVTALADAQLRDVVAVPRRGGRYRMWGTFEVDTAVGPAADGGALAFWQAATRAFGPLPWPAVQVVLAPLDEPLGLSFPGVVLLAERLLATPLRARWLYLAHELVHQWLGNTVRFAPGSVAQWEAWVDAVTWHLAETVAYPQAGPAYRAVYRGYLDAGGELAARGRRVLAFRQRIENGEVALAALGPPQGPRYGREERVAC